MSSGVSSARSRFLSAYVRALATCSLVLTLTLFAGAAKAAPPDVATYHNDNSRTGLNSKESVLKPSNVNVNSFGALFTQQVDGQVYAQPLYLYKVTMADTKVHNVVYVATAHNSVYAFDADSSAGANANPLWKVNFGASVPNGELGSDDINPEIGIIGAPVIDRAGGVLYVVSKVRGQDSSGNPTYTQQLHALDITSGAEKLGGPVTVEATAPGVGDGNDGAGSVPFNAKIQHQRSALLLAGGQVIIVWASHGDNGPYHGWVMAYDAHTLKQTYVFNTSPNAVTNGYPLAAAGIWMGGAGPAADSANSIFMVTGNGLYDLIGSQKPSYGDSILRFDSKGGYHIGDYFTPTNQQDLDNADADLGSGGILLLPNSVGSYNHPHIAVSIGKDGILRLTDRDKLGRFDPFYNNDVQEFGGIGGVWGMPAYFNGSIYTGGSGDYLKAFSVGNGHIYRLTSQSPTGYGYPGPTPSVSANGTTNSIVWAIDTSSYSSGGNSVLHAYDATNLSSELYNSNQAGARDAMGGATKFTVPTVVNGKVYVGSRNQLTVFGNATFTPSPTVSPVDGVYPSPLAVKITDTASNAVIYFTTDGSDPIPGKANTYKYSAPLSRTKPTTIKAIAVAPQKRSSGTVIGNFMVGAAYGTGTGLTGHYYNDPDGNTHLQGTPTTVQVDPTINFDWNGASPAAGIGGNSWSAEWTGKIQALGTTAYTFGVNGDDGVRLWVNGKLLVDGWVYQAPTWYYGTIDLVAGKKYDIKIDFFQGGGGSVAQLYWGATGLPWQPVPKSQLYSK